MKRLLIIGILVSFVAFQTSTASAATKAASSFSASAQFLKPKNTVRAYFGNLKGVSKVNYTLMYEGNGVGQGVVGSFAPGKKTSFSRDLYLGTCSGKVCIQHKNIKNIQIQVTTKYTNGKSSSKTIKVK